MCSYHVQYDSMENIHYTHTHTRTHEVQNDLIELSIYVLPSCADLPSSTCPFCEWLRERGWGREREREKKRGKRKGR